MATTPRHKIEDGWTVVEDVQRKIVPIEELELFAFLKEGEYRISSEEMRRRAKEAEADFGLDQAEYLLGKQEKVPKGYRDFDLLFPGSVLRSPGGALSVPSISWSGRRWYLFSDFLGSAFYSYPGERLVRHK